MNEELKITSEDIELLKQMKENCLKADLYDDEKRLLKANAITKFLILQNNWNELKEWLEEILQEEFDINGFTGVCTEISINCILDKMQELENSNNE